MLVNNLLGSLLYLLNTDALKMLKQIAAAFDIEFESIPNLIAAIGERITEWLGVILIISDIATLVIDSSIHLPYNLDGVGELWSDTLFVVNIMAIFMLLAFALVNALQLNIETKLYLLNSIS
ncbi:hypothetical protein KJ855_00065, partial [Patescibacteria group bacterium]|nr:hypothetical protein [Patescibacteria group bacterium]